jgi:hypothetical protein
MRSGQERGTNATMGENDMLVRMSNNEGMSVLIKRLKKAKTGSIRLAVEAKFPADDADACEKACAAIGKMMKVVMPKEQFPEFLAKLKAEAARALLTPATLKVDGTHSRSASATNRSG